MDNTRESKLKILEYFKKSCGAFLPIILEYQSDDQDWFEITGYSNTMFRYYVRENFLTIQSIEKKVDLNQYRDNEELIKDLETLLNHCFQKNTTIAPAKDYIEKKFKKKLSLTKLSIESKIILFNMKLKLLGSKVAKFTSLDKTYEFIGRFNAKFPLLIKVLDDYTKDPGWLHAVFSIHVQDGEKLTERTEKTLLRFSQIEEKILTKKYKDKDEVIIDFDKIIDDFCADVKVLQGFKKSWQDFLERNSKDILKRKSMLFDSIFR